VEILKRNFTFSQLGVPQQRCARKIGGMGGSKERKDGERKESGHHGDEREKVG
jgi:hypothetical protein